VLPQAELLTLADEAIADAVVECGGGLVIDGGAEEDVLILLRGVVGDVIEIPSIRDAGGIDAVVEGAANLGVSAGLPADVGDRVGSVILVVGQGVAGLEPTECAKVIELVEADAGNFLTSHEHVEVAGAHRLLRRVHAR